MPCTWYGFLMPHGLNAVSSCVPLDCSWWPFGSPARLVAIKHGPRLVAAAVKLPPPKGLVVLAVPRVQLRLPCGCDPSLKWCKCKRKAGDPRWTRHDHYVRASFCNATAIVCQTRESLFIYIAVHKVSNSALHIPALFRTCQFKKFRERYNPISLGKLAISCFAYIVNIFKPSV